MEMSSTRLCLVFLGVVIIHIGFFAVTCSVVLSASPAIAIDGESITLTCTYSGSDGVAGFAWFLNGNTLAAILLPACTPFANPGPPDPTLFEYACLSNNQSSFTVKRISLKQNGDRWQCAAAAPGYLYSSNVTITVEVAVTNVSLQSPSSSITEHIKTTFSCKTSPSKPAANITWYKESGGGKRQMITNEIVSSTENVGDLQMSTSILKYSPNRSDNGYEIFCTAINIAGRTPITSAKFKMLVQYPPNYPPKIQDLANGTTYKVIENNESMLTCIINGGNPLATLTWVCFNNGLPTVINGTTVTKSVLWNATRGPDRSCTCQSSHPVTGIQTVLINVHVLYMAVVTLFTVKEIQSRDPLISSIVNESANVILECTVDSNPSSSIEINFKDRPLSKTDNAKRLNYTLFDVSCLDTGVYTCTAKNQYNSGKSSKMALTLFVRCSPRPQIHYKENVSSALGHDTTLVFKGLAYPIPIFTWMKRDGDQWRTLYNSSNAIISISETDSNLTIRTVTLSDYGEYQLKIENEINYFIQPYFLSQEDVPDAPDEFQVVEEHISDTFALLRWKPGFSGGPKHSFVLLYKRPSEQDWKSETVEDTRDTLMIYTIHKLASDSVYTVVLLARNSAGDSVNSPNITFRTKETRKCVGKETNSAVSEGMIGGIVGGIVLCFVVVAVACFLFRRQIICSKGHLKKTPDKAITREHEYVDLKQTQNVNINPVYDDLQTDSENTEMTSNNIYVRPGTEDKESEKHVYTDLERQTEHSEENKMYANVKI